ncbi:MAG: L,D-transpeptidase family protein [Flavobacteriales bacterium]|nr:L,D-transpeptidase family protein [Flavobacteriales bacterium]
MKKLRKAIYSNAHKNKTIVRKINHLLALALIAITLVNCQDQSSIQSSTSVDEADNPSRLKDYFLAQFTSEGWKSNLATADYSQTKSRIESTYSKTSRSIWFNDQGLSRNGDDLLFALNNIAGYGLDSSLFDLSTINKLVTDATSQEDKLIAELRLTSEYMRLATYLNRGYLSRAEYQPIFELDSVKVDLPQHLVDAAEKESITESLTYLEPQIPEYKHLRSALMAYTQQFPISETTTVVSPYKDDSTKCISESAIALVTFGYLDSLTMQNDSLVDLAIKLFQRHNGLNEDGKPGKYTIKAFGKSNKYRYLLAQATLTKLRWKENQDRKSYLYVNIPSYTMKITENGQYIQQHRAVVGKSWTKTPELTGQLEYFIMNPRWHVPYSISSTELLRKASKDSTYLSRNGYVVSKGGTRLNSKSINWTGVTGSNFDYKISQNSGSGNALGRIKFIFPNSENVYMHDTPSRSLFANDIRSYSHGCVRLHKPVDLAKYLAEKQDLSVHKDSIQARIDSRINRKVTLKEKIKVYIEYYVSGTDLDGGIQFYLNIYKKDLDLIDAVKHGGAVAEEEEV